MKPLITNVQIAERIEEIVKEINCDYVGKDLVILMVLKGAICLVADLIRALDVPFVLETVQCISYRGKERGDLQVIGVERLQVEGKDLLIVDDIYDSGSTMTTLIQTLQMKKCRSIKSCVLLNKLGVPKLSAYVPDYILFTIDNLFTVGYGLDYKERYRGLPGIYILEGS